MAILNVHPVDDDLKSPLRDYLHHDDEVMLLTDSGGQQGLVRVRVEDFYGEVGRGVGIEGIPGLGDIVIGLQDSDAAINALVVEAKLDLADAEFRLNQEIVENTVLLDDARTRLALAEGNIVDQGAEILDINNEILLRAYQSEVNVIEGRVTDTEASVLVLSDSVALKAEQVEVDVINSQVQTNLANITLNTTSISTKVEQVIFDELDGRVFVAESEIVQNAKSLRLFVYELDMIVQGSEEVIKSNKASIDINKDEIGLRVRETVFNDLEGRVTTAETSIVLNTTQISLSATQAEVDLLTGTVAGNTASITLNATEIQARVLQTSFDALENRTTVAESLISQNASNILLKVNQVDFDQLGNRVTTAETQISQNASDILLRVTQVSFDALGVQVSTNTADINSNATQISLKVNQTDFDGLGNRVTTAETNIAQNSSDILLRATQVQVDGIDGRVTTNEASILVNATSITTKVGNDEVYSKLTQNMEGFIFATNYLIAENWDGTVDVNGNMTLPGTTGFGFDKFGVASLQKAFIGGFVIGGVPGGTNSDTIKAGDLELIGGANPALVIKEGSEEVVRIDDTDTDILNVRLSAYDTLFSNFTRFTSAGQVQTFSIGAEVTYDPIVIDRLSYVIDADESGNTYDVQIIVKLEVEAFDGNSWTSIALTADRNLDLLINYPPYGGGDAQDAFQVFDTVNLSVPIQFTPSEKYTDYRIKVTNQGVDTGWRVSYVYYKSILPSTKVNKKHVYTRNFRTLGSYRLLSSDDPNTYVLFVTRLDYNPSTPSKEVALIAEFYVDGSYVGESLIGKH